MFRNANFKDWFGVGFTSANSAHFKYELINLFYRDVKRLIKYFLKLGTQSNYLLFKIVYKNSVKITSKLRLYAFALRFCLIITTFPFVYFLKTLFTLIVLVVSSYAFYQSVF